MLPKPTRIWDGLLLPSNSSDQHDQVVLLIPQGINSVDQSVE